MAKDGLIQSQNAYLNQYRKNNIETATQEELFLMLFNALVKFVTKAKNAMEAKDIQETHNNIIKAQNILLEFIETLDFSVNEELATNLRNLYQYNIQLLMKANIKKDIAAITESLNMLQGLRDTWKQAVELSKKEKAQNFISATSPAPADENDELDNDDEEETHTNDYEV